MNDLDKTDELEKPTTVAGQTEFALLACPFCGGKAEVVESGPSGKEYVTHWQARCASVLTGCIGAEIDTWRCTEGDAVNAWNNRFSQPVEVVLGHGDKLVRDVSNSDDGWAGFCISHGECQVGHKIKAGETDNDLGAFLRIRTHNPDSLDVIIAACERAKMKLAEAG